MSSRAAHATKWSKHQGKIATLRDDLRDALALSKIVIARFSRSGRVSSASLAALSSPYLAPAYRAHRE